VYGVSQLSGLERRLFIERGGGNSRFTASGGLGTIEDDN
jgi:hypothetical protein